MNSLLNIQIVVIIVLMMTVWLDPITADDCQTEKNAALQCLADKWKGISLRTAITAESCCQGIESTCVDYKFVSRLRYLTQ